MRVSDFPELHSKFSVFDVINPRARRNEALFSNLKGVILTKDQKDFFARQCIGEILDDESDIRFEDSNRSLSDRYGLSHGTTSGWVANYKKPNAVNQAGKGRPLKVDKKGFQDVFAVVKAGKKIAGKSNKSQKKSLYISNEVTELLNIVYRQTLKRKGHNIDEHDERVCLSSNTINKYKKVCIMIIILFQCFIANYYISDQNSCLW
jgi:hypothetical protein